MQFKATQWAKVEWSRAVISVQRSRFIGVVHDKGDGCNKFFFPRVRTPCGHGAQVIVEGSEDSQMVEKRTRTPNQPKQTNHRPQAESPPSCSLSSVLGETGETKLVTINGPEFSNEKHGSVGRCSRKISKRLQMDFAS